MWPVGYFLRAKLYFARQMEETQPGVLQETIRFIRSTLSNHNAYIQTSDWRSLPELTNKDGAVSYLSLWYGNIGIKDKERCSKSFLACTTICDFVETKLHRRMIRMRGGGVMWNADVLCSLFTCKFMTQVQFSLHFQICYDSCMAQAWSVASILEILYDLENLNGWTRLI